MGNIVLYTSLTALAYSIAKAELGISWEEGVGGGPIITSCSLSDH